MQKTLSDVAKLFVESGHGHDDLVLYANMKEHPGWEVHRKFLITMGSLLANRVLEKKFQALDSNEKLIQLAAYSKMNEVIKFLLDPAPKIINLAKIKQHNTNMGATRKRKRPKEKK